MPVKRPQTQQLQVESFLALQTIVNSMNCEFRRHEPDNAGIDGEIDLVKGGAFEGKLLKFQLKAGRSYISSENEDFVKVRVEKRYVELWKAANFPVILFFYHPDTKVVYWKSVQDYLRCDPKIIRIDSNNVIFPFDKLRDTFSQDTLAPLRRVTENNFAYEKIIYIEDRKEEILSNWFPVISLPQKVYIAPCIYRDHGDISRQLKDEYVFILKPYQLCTFSDLTNPDCELREFCEVEEAVLEIKSAQEIEPNWYMQLLNEMIYSFCIQNELIARDERFYFSARVLDTKEADNTRFTFQPLKRSKDTGRLKIYINKVANVVEYKHMATRLNFIKDGADWYLQIDPDWQFSYPFDSTKTKREIGQRLIKEKAAMYNEQYLYLLHAWKQYLSSSSGMIVFSSDNLDTAQTAQISTRNISFLSDFMLFNDYFGPKEGEIDA